MTSTGITNMPGVQFGDTGAASFFTNIVTNFFKPVLADARNNATPAWSAMKKGMAKMDISGSFIIWPVRTGRNRGRNAVRDGRGTTSGSGEIPDPGAQQYGTYSMESRTYMSRIKIDGATLDRAQTDGGAFADAVTLEMEGQVDDIMVDHGRMIHNDGSGRLCEFSSGTAGGVVTARINQSIPAAATCSTKPVLYLEVGDRVGFYVPAQDKLRALSTQTGFYVASINSNSTFTLASTAALTGTVNVTAGWTDPGDGTVAVTAGDWIVRVSNEVAANVNSSAARGEMIGFGGILSADGVLDGNSTSSAQQQGSTALTTTSVTSGPFQGIAATAANPFNRAIVETSGNNTTRQVNEDFLQQAVSDFEEFNNGELKLLLSSYSTYNSFFSALRGDKRYNSTKLEGGHTLLEFNGVGFLKDRFCYGNRIIGLDPSQFMYHEVSELKPMAPFGIPRWERLNDTEAYWTGMVARGNIGVDVRQRSGFVLADLNA